MYRTEYVRVVDLEPGMMTALVAAGGIVTPYGEIVATRRVSGGIEVDVRYSPNDVATLFEDDNRLDNDSTFGIAVPELS